MAEFLQRTPTLQYTLGLVELACYRRRGQHDGLLVVPQIIARTTEITRAVVHIDLQGRDEPRSDRFTRTEGCPSSPV